MGQPIPNLDFLRTCAVLLVLVDHTLQQLGIHSMGGQAIDWLGRVGVLFFFVHTSCVLMMSIERHKDKGLFSHFYVRRAFRIYPLSIIAVLVAMIPPHATKLTPFEWVSNLTLTQNLTFGRDAFGSIWSLPIEVQMYLCLPFVFLLARQSKSVWPVLGLWAASLPLALFQPYLTSRGTVLAFVPAFLPGVAAYWIFRHRRPFFHRWGLPVCIAAIIAAFLVHPNWTFSAWLACLALGVLVPCFRQLTNPLLNKMSSIIATYSYGIYLSHGLLARWLHPTWSLASLTLYLSSVVLVSWGSYHVVEHPMIRFGQWLTGPPPAARESGS